MDGAVKCSVLTIPRTTEGQEDSREASSIGSGQPYQVAQIPVTRAAAITNMLA